MVVAERGERLAVQIDRAGPAFLHDADFRERQPFVLSRNARGGGRREKQFVILAAMQGLVESRTRESRRRGDRCLQPRRKTETAQVERDAVTQIHSGGGAAAKESAKPQARLGA